MSVTTGIRCVIETGSCFYKDDVSDKELVCYIFQKMFEMHNVFRLANETDRQDLVYDSFVKLLDFALKHKSLEDAKVQKGFFETLLETNEEVLLDGAVDFISSDAVKKYVDCYGVDDMLITACNKFDSLYNDLITMICEKLSDSDLGAFEFDKKYWDCLSLLTANTRFSRSNLWTAMNEITYVLCKLLRKINLEGNFKDENVKYVYQKWCDFIKHGLKTFYRDGNNSAISSFLFNFGIHLDVNSIAVIRKVVHDEEPDEVVDGEKILEDLGVWSLEDLKIDIKGDDIEVLRWLSPRLAQFCVQKE